jgi:hypothetical protein
MCSKGSALLGKSGRCYTASSFLYCLCQDSQLWKVAYLPILYMGNLIKIVFKSYVNPELRDNVSQSGRIVHSVWLKHVFQWFILNGLIHLKDGI